MIKLGPCHILLDYYDGAYGPTIRVDVISMDHLLKIHSVFQELAEGRVSVLNLVELPEVRSLTVDELVLKAIPTAEGVHLTVTRTGKRTFSWSASVAGWQRCVGLVDGLLEFDAPGHQYLNREGVDDALIELAFQERPSAL